MTDTIQLVTQTNAGGAFGDITETVREVFCSVKSVTRNEFYLATAQKLNPTVVFVLSDYYDYNGETVVIYNGERYTVIRTYRKDNSIELVCQRRAGT